MFGVKSGSIKFSIIAISLMKIVISLKPSMSRRLVIKEFDKNGNMRCP